MPTPENGGTLSNKSLTVEREIADGVWPLCGDGPERIKILPDKLPIPDGLTSFKVLNKFCQVVREKEYCRCLFRVPVGQSWLSFLWKYLAIRNC